MAIESSARNAGPINISRTSEWRRYAAFLREPPELTLAWRDAPTGARAWLVINSTRGGAAGGGTRMRSGLLAREVTYLAKAMELKFALAGPPIGGAKCGIDLDPAHPERAGVLERFYRAIEPLLRTRFGTGGDLNVDETLDVIPAFARIGIAHPQEGVVRGHVRPDDAGYRTVIRRLETGVVAPVDDARGIAGMALSVSDMITGFGVARAVERFLERQGAGIDGARVLLEGFGNVGASCALYLARAGARIVGISDARHVLRAPEGLTAHDIEELIRTRRNKLLPASDPRVVPAAADAFWQDADVFVCAAISESITPATLDRLGTFGVRIIACGSNQPFRELKVGSTRVAQQADRRFSVLADILSNCGMARALSYLMERDAYADANHVFAAVDDTITRALDEVIDRGRGRPSALLAATLGMVLDRVTSAVAP
jgi:glutamate dehydrogenase (NAD(P)+)